MSKHLFHLNMIEKAGKPTQATYSGQCVVSGKEYETAKFPLAAYERWKQGEVIQKALWMLSAEDREFMIAGISPDAWEKEFADLFEEDPEEEDFDNEAF